MSATTAQRATPHRWTTGELLALEERHRAGASIGLLAAVEGTPHQRIDYLLRQARRIRTRAACAVAGDGMSELLDVLTSHRVGFFLIRVALGALCGLGFASFAAGIGEPVLVALAIGAVFVGGFWIGWTWLPQVAKVRKEDQ